MHLIEDGNEPGAGSFRWQMLATGGEPALGGMGFSNPDNLLIAPDGNVWMVTDMSTSKHNKAVLSRVDAEGKPLEETSLQGIFGNNSIWFIPTTGENAGKAYLFGMGPMECETTGPFFTRDQQTLFLAVQHPGEANGIRKNQATETRQFAMKTVDGQDFIQNRAVPIGSNWPGKMSMTRPSLRWLPFVGRILNRLPQYELN
jgi:secreted PhoX family phosphatase